MRQTMRPAGIRYHGGLTKAPTTVALLLGALALTGLFLFVVALGEQHQFDRMMLELSLIAPLFVWSLAGRFRLRQ